MAASSTALTPVHEAVAHALAGRGDHDVDEIAAVLEDECFLGSALDVADAVGHLLASPALAQPLYEALERINRKRPCFDLRDIPHDAESAKNTLAALEWKREYKTHAERFDEPYLHQLSGTAVPLVLHQTPFDAEGFASTIWDSSIVLARYLERHAARNSGVGRRCIELGAGCGLPGLVLHALGADVTLTDLSGNLPLLEKNVRANSQASVEDRAKAGGASVVELTWREGPLPSHITGAGPFDLIIATDVLYSHEAVTPLVATLVRLASARASAPGRGASTSGSGPAPVLLAAGRNRHAGDAFFAQAREAFHIAEVPCADLDPVYQCEDVTVWYLELRGAPLRRLEVDGVTYEVEATLPGAGKRRSGGGTLRRLLADGNRGPVVGCVAGDGSITIDESAWAGDWVDELLTATLPPTAAGEGSARRVPPDVATAVAGGRAAEWRGALDHDLLSACREEMRALEADDALSRRNHAQAASVRGDRIAFLRIDKASSQASAELAACEDEEEEEHPTCPPNLRKVFSALESTGVQLQEALGCGPLLTPRLGMVSRYDGAHGGYCRHLDNERASLCGPASGYRNFRVLTVIAYLNEPDWCQDDGGQLRCYPPRSEGTLGEESHASGGTPDLEVIPRGGTVVVFPSRSIPHEVLATRKPRLAATLWLVSSSLIPHGTDGSEDPWIASATASSISAAAVSSTPATSAAPAASWSCTSGVQALFSETADEAAAVAAGAIGNAAQFSFGFK